jgi:hypothetical protein
LDVACNGTSNCLQSNGKSNVNATAFTSGSTTVSNGSNIATATIGACTLVGNLGLTDYATGVSSYN